MVLEDAEVKLLLILNSSSSGILIQVTLLYVEAGTETKKIDVFLYTVC
jgi:hypothetical protein